MMRLIKLQLRNIFTNKVFYVCTALTVLAGPILNYLLAKSLSGTDLKVFPQIDSFLSGEVGIINAIFIALLYGTFQIMLFRGSIFWITASILYVFPILPFLMFIYHYILNDNKNHIVIYYILCGLLVFLASFSQEQISAMVVGYIAMLIVSLIGFAILMLAPGNSIRMLHPTSVSFYSLGLIDKIKLNLPQIILNNFSNHSLSISLTLPLTYNFIVLGIINNCILLPTLLILISILSILFITPPTIIITYYK